MPYGIKFRLTGSFGADRKITQIKKPPANGRAF